MASCLLTLPFPSDGVTSKREQRSVAVLGPGLSRTCHYGGFSVTEELWSAVCGFTVHPVWGIVHNLPHAAELLTCITTKTGTTPAWLKRQTAYSRDQWASMSGNFCIIHNIKNGCSSVPILTGFRKRVSFVVTKWHHSQCESLVVMVSPAYTKRTTPHKKAPHPNQQLQVQESLNLPVVRTDKAQDLGLTRVERFPPPVMVFPVWKPHENQCSAYKLKTSQTPGAVTFSMCLCMYIFQHRTMELLISLKDLVLDAVVSWQVGGVELENPKLENSTIGGHGLHSYGPL